MIENKLLVSVVMIDGGFRENFHAVDSFCRQSMDPGQYELIWVEYYDSIHPQLEQIISTHRHARVVRLKKTDIYHSSYCFNEGIRQSQADIIAIPDADILVEKDFLAALYDEHCQNQELVMYFYRQCQEEHFFKPGDLSIEYIKQTSRITKPDNYGGCLSVRKKWLLEIGGYEQHRAFATGNHANGKDVYTRLKNLGLCIKWHPEKFLYHPWHPGTNGAGADKKRVNWQWNIISYRGSQLMAEAFEGLSGRRPVSHTVPPPPLGDPDA